MMATQKKRQARTKKRPQQRANQAPIAVPSSPFTGETWAFMGLVLAVFLFIAVHFPNTTGIVGALLIEKGLAFLFGISLLFLPLFVIFTAICLLYRPQRWVQILAGGTANYLIFAVFMAMIGKPKLLAQLFPFSTDGGGWFGLQAYTLSEMLLGNSGTLLLILAASVFSMSLVLNLPFFVIAGRFIFRKLRGKAAAPAHNAATGVARKTKTSPSSKKDKQVNPDSGPVEPETAIPPLPESETTVDSFDMPESLPVDAPKKAEDLAVTISSKAGTGDHGHYVLPPLTLLDRDKKGPRKALSKEASQEKARLLENTLESFNVNAKVVHITQGPSVTRFELQPGHGVKINKITTLSKDIALKLAASDVRIEAPIPGKALVGIEVPNDKTDTITLKSIIDATDMMNESSMLSCALGMTITGESILMTLNKMPHILIAGATGSGKSVCVNAIIMSILLRATPEDVRFIMIDPKKVELSLYDGIPHLQAPVVTDPSKAAATLKQGALVEMERRYELFSKLGVKNIEGFNEKLADILTLSDEEKGAIYTFFHLDDDAPPPKKLPWLVVIIDELADLMMVASQDVETSICRLAQMSRATGIHLVIATQRPSVNVVTGLIKANVPSRISFYLQSQIDSRTILDMPGAEKLLGKGDMLYSPVGSFNPQRLQGIYISEKEVKNVVQFWKKQGGPSYDESLIDIEPLAESGASGSGEGEDALYDEAKQLVMSSQYASTSYLQRKLRVGYNRAARIMDELEANGVISEYAGERKPRNMT